MKKIIVISVLIVGVIIVLYMKYAPDKLRIEFENKTDGTRHYRIYRNGTFWTGNQIIHRDDLIGTVSTPDSSDGKNKIYVDHYADKMVITGISNQKIQFEENIFK